MKWVAKAPFQGNALQGQLSFPVGAVIVQTMDAEHAPRNGWMHGDFQGDVGWFPASYVEPVGGSLPPAPSLPEANMVGAQTGMSSSAPPVASAMPIPETGQGTAIPTIALDSSMHSSNHQRFEPPVFRPLDEQQIAQLMEQGFTRGELAPDLCPIIDVN